MFCDLVDSTKLSSQLDPEEYRDVVRAYQQVCTEVIHAMMDISPNSLAMDSSSTLAIPRPMKMMPNEQYALGWVSSLRWETSIPRLQQAKGIQLAVRLGIHTGLVVVGDMGGAGRQEQLGTGEVPNIASRIQGLAAPNTIAISEATYRLVQGYFECQDLGAQTLRGVAEPSTCTASSRRVVPRVVWMWLSPEDSHRWSVENKKSVSSWNGGSKPRAGQGQVVLLTGDAGIGKVPVGPNAERACCQRAAYALGMSECGVLSEYGAVSSDGFVPTPVAVPSRGYP